MGPQAPSLRDPHSFYDVIGVLFAGVTVMVIVLTLWHGTIIRIEMGVFFVAIVLWVIWAINHILVQRAGQTRRKLKRKI